MGKDQEREPGKGPDLSQASQQVLDLAHEEALRLNHNYIDTEHILLGLVREGTVAEILEGFDVSLPKARSALEFFPGRGRHPVIGEIDHNPRAELIIKLAINEARRDCAGEVTPIHLLRGVAIAGKGKGIGTSGILESLGVDCDRLYLVAEHSQK